MRKKLAFCAPLIVLFLLSPLNTSRALLEQDHAEKGTSITETPGERRSRSDFWPEMAIAAVAVVLNTMAAYFFLYPRQLKDNLEQIKGLAKELNTWWENKKAADEEWLEKQHHLELEREEKIIHLKRQLEKNDQRGLQLRKLAESAKQTKDKASEVHSLIHADRNIRMKSITNYMMSMWAFVDILQSESTHDDDRRFFESFFEDAVKFTLALEWDSKEMAYSDKVNKSLDQLETSRIKAREYAKKKEEELNKKDSSL
jgi:hypothetical protein